MPNRRIYPRLALLLLVIGFVAFSALNTLLFGGVRADLTENQLYTISDGTRQILHGIDEPLDLHFFFSDKATRDAAQLRTYARRVRELLEEYAAESGGKIRLKIIDPEPFSEAEDQAGELGLQSVPLDGGSQQVWFGLAASNAYGEHQSIPFFQPEKEEFLEYDLSKLIAGLTAAKKPVIGLLSGLSIGGGFDMMSSQPTPAWMVVDQLRQTFEVKTVPMQGDKIDEDITTLMIVHPGALTDAMQYAIDQFVLKGGKLIAFVDPFCESARAGGNPMMDQSGPATSSDLARLFAAWGVSYDANKVVGDAAVALQIQFAQDQPAAPHIGFLGLTPDNIEHSDVVTANLETLNLGFVGAFAPVKDATTRFEPLLTSSTQAELVDSMGRDPVALMKDFKPTGQRYTLAARIGGPAKSAFAGPQQEGQPHVAESQDIHVVVVADADMLADRFWVQVQDFFGQRIAQAWADNASFVQNAVENLSGNSALIGVRGRGRFSRPFDRVQTIRAAADATYRAHAEELQQRLDDTEHQLEELQKGKDENKALVLSPEQEQALLDFQQQKLRIRKELREVRHQLDSDIEGLGTLLKIGNIVVAPLALTLLLLGWHRWRQASRRRRDEAALAR
jgi:ABC-type uncharacterized transport system involved in gliding motility auxiliary subunit